MNIAERLSRQPQWVILLEALCLVLVIGIADFWTGYDVSLFVLYALPILFVVSFSGRPAGILVCIASATAWCLADAKAGHPYKDSGILAWNTTVQLGFFIFTMVAGSALKFQLAQTRARISQLERFQILAEISPVGIFRTGTDGGCVYANQRWCKIAGVSDPQALRQSWTDALHSDDRERVATEWKRATEENQPLRFEGRFQHPNGKVIWALGQVAAEKDTSGVIRGYVGAITDMTEHRRLEREILEVSEREQQRIGQDLHDDLCQFLAAIQYTATSLGRDLQRNAAPQATNAKEVAELLKAAVVRTRGLARGIFPVKLEQDGLASALHELATSASRAFHLTCTFECDPPVLVEDASVATHLYRITQEALNNAIKHGKAAHVTITLSASDDVLQLTIEDDGIGFPEDLPEDHQGMGLRTMEYRSNFIGGTLEISRNGRSGTVVACSLRNVFKKHEPAETVEQACA